MILLSNRMELLGKVLIWGNSQSLYRRESDIQVCPKTLQSVARSVPPHILNSVSAGTVPCPEF